jgi:DNA-binding response OmpR family regulator
MIVDDDAELASALGQFLRDNGFDCRIAHDVPAARREYAAFLPQLCLVDIVMPGQSGRVFCREIAEQSDVGIIMMSSLSDSETIIALLEIGADDYIVKPFKFAEIFARMRALLRRSSGRAKPVPAQRLGPWHFEFEARRLRHDEGFTVRLTPSEMQVLRFMAASPGTTFTRADLLTVARSRQHGGADDRAIDNLIKRLRRKIEEDPSNARYVVTVWGKGFRIDP